MEYRHDASGQLSGYLYQVLMALWLLIKTENADAQVLIEKFDDISFIEEDSPLAMIQVKHQLYKVGNLGDTSTDLWRSLNSWIDTISDFSLSVNDTQFVIITTAQASAGSIVAFLGYEGRDASQALSKLNEIAKNNTQATNAPFYKKFLSLDDDIKKHLIDNVFIIFSAPQIADIKDKIMPFIRMATIPTYEDKVYDKVIGWWITKVIDGLTSKDPKTISYKQLRYFLNDCGSEYKSESLPISVDSTYQPTEKELTELSGEDKIFIEQLKLITMKDAAIKRCIKDYYNAYMQRSLWVREQVLYTDDLAVYEKRLKNEWERKFENMVEDLEDYGPELDEAKKVAAGKKLFRNIEEQDIKLKNVEDPFIMRGTYHGMANELKVGWHMDFSKRLCHLLKGDANGTME